MRVMAHRGGGGSGGRAAETPPPAAGEPPQIPDPFRAPDRAWKKASLALYGVLVMFSGLALGWRAAVPFLFMLLGAAIEIWVAEGPPRAAGKRVPGAILAARGWRWRTLGAALAVTGLGVIALEDRWRGREPPGPGHGVALLTFVGVVAAIAIAVRLAATRRAVRLTSSGLEEPAGPFRAGKTLAWLDVAEITYERDAFVAAGKGARIALHKAIDGLGDFAALALTSAPASAIDRHSGMRDRLLAMAARLESERAARRSREGSALVR
jgi:hypothetical protein